MDWFWRFGKWIFQNAGTIASIIAIISAVAALIAWVWSRTSARRKLDKAGLPYTLESLVERARQGDGDPHIVRWYLRAGMQANLRDDRGRTALVAAVSAGQIATVTLLVSRRWRIGRFRFGRRWTDPNRPDGSPVTPIEAALGMRRRDIYDVLIAGGARSTAEIRAAVLRQAVEAGAITEIRRRVQALAKPEEIDIAGPDGRNALLIAVERGQRDAVRPLLEAHADPNASNRGVTALLTASREGRGPIVDELLYHGADAGRPGPIGETPLILAAEGGYLAIVQALLGRKAKVDAADTRGRTALMAAILGGYDAIAALLRKLSNAGEAEARLILAADAGDLQEVARLLAAGANANAQAAGGRCALLAAACRGHTAVGALLIAKGGANHKLADDRGYTALMYAAEAGSRDFAVMLLGAGADVNASRDDGSTALMDAASNSQAAVVAALLDAEPPPAVDATRADGFTPLMAAVERGNPEVVKSLLTAHADPNVEADGVTPLTIAIARGDAGMTQLLRDKGATLGALPGQMFDAVRRGNLQQVKALLAGGVSANLLDHRRSTPLLEALRRKHVSVAKELIEADADVNHAGPGGTPLQNAARIGSLMLVEMLLDRGARIDARGRTGKTALLVACERNHVPVIDSLLARNADVNAADDLGRTPLLIAILEGREAIEDRLRACGATKGELEARLIRAARKSGLTEIRDILAENPNVDTRGPRGETALIVACEQANSAVVAALLEAGADTNVKMPSGKTPLTVAARRGDLAVVDALLESGARVDLTGDDNRTPLMFAAEHGHLPVVQRLLGAKNNPNERDRTGLTALMVASQNGHAGVVAELLDAAAEIDLRGPAGQTALLRATARGHTAVQRALVDRGADVDAADDERSTPLIHAALAGHLGTVSLLVEENANVNARDASGQTPLMIAMLGRDAPIETVLRAKGATAGENEAKLIQAAETGALTMVQTLLGDQIDLNARRRGDSPALIAAIEKAHGDIAQLLIDKDADVNIRGRAGRTPLIAAAARDDLALVQALTAHNAGATCEVMDDDGLTAVLATKSEAIRLHLKNTCGAMQPGDRVEVTSYGHRYHLQSCTHVKRVGSTPSELLAASRAGRRPCSDCILRQAVQDEERRRINAP
jgi:ankyrin repeat protein